MMRHLVLAGLLGAGMTSSATAAVLLSENFEGDTVGSAPGNAAIGSAGMTVRDDTTASPFGAGNQWLEMASNGGAWFFANLDGDFAADVATLSFDAYFDSTNFTGRWRLRAQADGNGNLVGVDLGNTAPFEVQYVPTPDVAQHYDIVVNTTGAAAGATAANTMEVFVNGTSVLTTPMLTSGLAIDRFTLWQNNNGSAGTSLAYIDNLEVRDEAFVVPEPASVALLGLSGIAMLRRRR